MSGIALKSPYPWFGGKSTVAAEVWRRFGDCPNYVEPFFGSGAVLLARPHEPKIETINDKDMFVANFWRAVRSSPDEVARYADWPVNEADLEARHAWLVTDGAARLAANMGDPEWSDPQIAGWWCWGLCSWIGSGWCSGGGPWSWASGAGWAKADMEGINRQRPHLGNAGQGINEWMCALAERLRRVRVCCGDWARVCGPSVTHTHGLTSVFLDPPYSAAANRTGGLYATDSLSVAHDVAAWARENGGNPKMRIALCGYDTEHAMPDDWSAWAWRAKGGYGSQGAGVGRENAKRETIWFSPHCLNGRIGLFGDAA